MILVLTGTSPYSFHRLVEAADKYAEKYKEEMFIQLGHTDYSPVHAKYKRFLNKKELLKKIEEASLIISQGGFGSIADCLQKGKKVVAVPRKSELKEALHQQEELVREMEKLGRLVGVYQIDDLSKAIQKAGELKVIKREKSSIPNIINKFIAENE